LPIAMKYSCQGGFLYFTRPGSVINRFVGKWWVFQRAANFFSYSNSDPVNYIDITGFSTGVGAGSAFEVAWGTAANVGRGAAAAAGTTASALSAGFLIFIGVLFYPSELGDGTLPNNNPNPNPGGAGGNGPGGSDDDCDEPDCYLQYQENYSHHMGGVTYTVRFWCLYACEDGTEGEILAASRHCRKSIKKSELDYMHW